MIGIVTSDNWVIRNGILTWVDFIIRLRLWLKKYVKLQILTWDCLLSNWNCDLIHINFLLELELWYKIALLSI